MPNINVRINDKLNDRFQAALEREGISKTQVVINAVHEFVTKSESRKGDGKMKLYYENILVGEVLTNRSMTVEEALDAIGFDEQKFIEEHGFDDIDHNDFRMEY